MVTCKNPNPAAPGHIAIVRPSTKSDDQILAEGPQIIQAGARNYSSASTKAGFKNHPGAFENRQLLYFAHKVSLSVTDNQAGHFQALQSSASSTKGSN